MSLCNPSTRGKQQDVGNDSDHEKCPRKRGRGVAKGMKCQGTYLIGYGSTLMSKGNCHMGCCQIRTEIEPRNLPPLEKSRFCSALFLPSAAPALLGRIGLVSDPIGFPNPPAPILLAGKIVVLDLSATLALGLTLRFYASEEAKSKTGKNEGSDELEG
ncbi:hypothetical protein SLEP1_g15236 [Rubroshorea leprosula]|uniref:Uncharacterized protein n=1 Tax=Rubroshorea leprosula TaxID=152421 RepID=A0AAV5ILP9_9ROSI|nr:hypothetical protein SLEP1_g15236 [Rubroshorea leprosula]